MGRILVVDDAQFVRRWCRTVLTEQAHEVFEAMNGEQAVLAYDELRPDLVLLDLVMPGVDGLAALRRIREADPHARVVVLTTEGHLHVVNEARRAGAADFLLNPCAKEVLLDRVARALA